LFFAHIPFVVNHTINATPPEWLQHHHVGGRSIRKQAHRVESPMEYYWELRSENAQSIKALMCPPLRHHDHTVVCNEVFAVFSSTSIEVKMFENRM